MASRLSNVKLFCHGSNLLESFLQPCCVIRKRNFHVNAQNSRQKDFHRSDLFKYGALLSFFSAIGLFLYSRTDKQKGSPGIFPTVQALAKSEDSLRKRFNFISEVVEKSADAVVFLENTVLFRLNGVDISGVRGGSGFIVRDDGLILTNAHVVADRETNYIQVKLKDGRILNGEIESVDFVSDLATVRVKAKNLPVMKLGSSADLKAGEWVIAMGSPLNLKDSVSVGIVSSLQRKGAEIGQCSIDMEYIQTDAAIAMGNSGGPLINLDGEVVGVNSLAVISGISFAIPIDYAKEFLRKTEEGKERGERNIETGWPNYIGIFMQTLTPEIFFQMRRSFPFADHAIPEFLLYGVLISRVLPGSPAFRSGLFNGDIIVEVNGERLMGNMNFLKHLGSQKLLNLKVFRGNSLISIILVPDLPMDGCLQCG